MPLKQDTRGLCHLCDEPSSLVIEINIYAKPPAGSGRNRGTYVKGSTRRVCEGHAKQFMTVMSGDRRTSPSQNGERRRGLDRRTI